LWTAVGRTGRISWRTTDTPRDAACQAASEPANPPPTIVTVFITRLTRTTKTTKPFVIFVILVDFVLLRQAGASSSDRTYEQSSLLQMSCRPFFFVIFSTRNGALHSGQASATGRFHSVKSQSG
jgi:hypothetical protein